MTDQEINIAIAEACGLPVCAHSPVKWERRGTDGDSELFCTECKRYLSDMRVQKYCTDLNAMHEAEKQINHACDYQAELERVWRRDEKVPAAQAWIWHATAYQRAEAFLRTFNLWKPN